MASLKIHEDYKTLLEDDFCKNETIVSSTIALQNWTKTELNYCCDG